MIWHDIPGFPDYQVTKSAIIRRKRLGRYSKMVVTQTSDRSYLGVKLRDEFGLWKRVKVHVVMMAAFIGPRPDKLVINHIDGDKFNNKIDNLEYCTQLENERHSLTVLGKTHTRGPDGRFIPSKI